MSSEMRTYIVGRVSRCEVQVEIQAESRADAERRVRTGEGEATEAIYSPRGYTKARTPAECRADARRRGGMLL